MLQKGFDLRDTVEIVSIEDRVPKGHLLRKIDAAVDFGTIYTLVGDRYSEEVGRPSVDPVVIFKIVLLQHLYGMPSLRRTVEEIGMNMAYRWFLGYNLSEPAPHFATVSYVFCQRYGNDIAEQVFAWILREVERAGYLEPEVVFLDGTHVKASANLKKTYEEAIPAAARIYDAQLRAEINADREAHGKSPFGDADKPERRQKRDENTSKRRLKNRKKQRGIMKSVTDPDAGLFHKGEHKRCFAYGAHTVCEKNNFVLDVEVTPGNLHDSVAFDAVYDRVTARFPEISVVTMDAGYRTPWIAKKIFDGGRIPSLPYKRPMTADYGHKWYAYVYDEHYDCVICPEFQILRYSTTNREGYREYKSDPKICAGCPTRQMCTHSKNFQKIVTRHVWQDYIDRVEDVRLSTLGEQTYKLRKQTIERVFADAKEKHGMRYTNHRGLARVQSWVRLKFAAMNLKKLALRRWKESGSSLLFAFLPLFLSNIQKKEFSLA